jgi:hypothetical protein
MQDEEKKCNAGFGQARSHWPPLRAIQVMVPKRVAYLALLLQVANSLQLPRQGGACCKHGCGFQACSHDVEIVVEAGIGRAGSKQF